MNNNNNNRTTASRNNNATSRINENASRPPCHGCIRLQQALKNAHTALATERVTSRMHQDKLDHEDKTRRSEKQRLSNRGSRVRAAAPPTASGAPGFLRREVMQSRALAQAPSSSPSSSSAGRGPSSSSSRETRGDATRRLAQSEVNTPSSSSQQNRSTDVAAKLAESQARIDSLAEQLRASKREVSNVHKYYRNELEVAKAKLAQQKKANEALKQENQELAHMLLEDSTRSYLQQLLDEHAQKLPQLRSEWFDDVSRVVAGSAKRLDISKVPTEAGKDSFIYTINGLVWKATLCDDIDGCGTTLFNKLMMMALDVGGRIKVIREDGVRENICLAAKGVLKCDDKKKIKVDTRLHDFSSVTPLLVAIQIERNAFGSGLCMALLDREVTPSLHDKERNNAAHHAAMRGRADVLERLLELRGPNDDMWSARNTSNKTPCDAADTKNTISFFKKHPSLK